MRGCTDYRASKPSAHGQSIPTGSRLASVAWDLRQRQMLMAAFLKDTYKVIFGFWTFEMHSQCSDANTLIEEVLAATFADPKDGELIKQMTDFLAYNFVTVFWYHTRKHCIFENMNRPLFGSIQLGWSQSSIPCIAKSDQSPYWGSQWSCLQRRLHLREHF